MLPECRWNGMDGWIYRGAVAVWNASAPTNHKRNAKRWLLPHDLLLPSPNSVASVVVPAAQSRGRSRAQPNPKRWTLRFKTLAAQNDTWGLGLDSVMA
jgi:hypothetical protein